MRRWLIVFLVSYGLIPCWAQDGFVAGSPRLAYWKTGHQNPIVIVLHGGPAATHQYLRPEFDGLLESAQVIYYDQRGCGKSDTSTSYIWQEHVADLRRVIQTFAKNQKVFLAGSSWGSLLAILYGYTYPDDLNGLILSGTVQWSGQEQVYKLDRTASGKPEKQVLVEQRIVYRRTSDGQAELDTLRITKETDIYFGSPQTQPLISMRSAPLAERLRQIKLPILLFTGSQTTNIFQKQTYRSDWVDHYEKLFPNVHVHTFNGAGHDPWMSDPDLFSSISNDFIYSISKQNKP